jgi:hypothetical protein
MKRSPEPTPPSPSSPSPSSGAARLSGLAVMAVAALSLLLAAVRMSPARAPVPGGSVASPAPPAKRMAPADAGRHEGEEAMVCGLVAATKYAAGARGRPTFLDFGAAYPDQVFQAVIWGSERARFHEAPEQAFLHKQVCVTGRIRLYRGKPEITVKDPAQLVLDQVIADPDFDQRARSTG